MKRFFLMFAVGLVLCAAKPPHPFSRRGLQELKRELALAQKELTQAQVRVSRLEEAIAQKEIERIKEQLGQIEEGQVAVLLQSREERLAFFSDQRETLSKIIRNHPMCALQAQAVLDQILTLITHISDDVIE